MSEKPLEEMTFEEISQELGIKCKAVETEINGRQSKLAHKRVRTLTKEISVLGKLYRKLSVLADK